MLIQNNFNKKYNRPKTLLKWFWAVVGEEYNVIFMVKKARRVE